MKRFIAAAAAAGVLVAGAFVASTVTTGTASAQSVEVQTTTDTDSEKPERGEHLEEVLSSLVTDGTLTQPQADAVQEALAAKHEELKAEREARQEERQAAREQVKEMLEDDVIDSSELAELGDDHPFNDPDGIFAEAAADGQITSEELKELRKEHRMDRRAKRSGSDEAEGDTA
ncbi:MAG: hypothetical protein ACR2N2_04480 [Acidimicrobiia bacterium]